MKAFRKKQYFFLKVFMLPNKKNVKKKRTLTVNQNFAKSLLTMIPKWIQFYVYRKNETIIYVSPENLQEVLFFLKDSINTQYKVLIDVTAIDYPSRSLRFQVVYNLLSIHYNSRIRIKTCVDELTPVPSITQIYSCAGWWEREVWDMFGIFFSNHPDLRRILTDYGFQGHPLRKDFPLTGYVEVRYDDSEKRVLTEPLELSQEFRYFDFASPWEQCAKKY